MVKPSPLGRLGVIVVCALVGFLLVSQVRGRVNDRELLETASEGDLARILATLNEEASSVRDDIAALRLQLLRLESASARDDAARRAATEQRQALEVLAGTVPVVGPGVVLRIDDPLAAVTAEIFIDIVQELRDAGAEAIAVNGHRLGVTSAFEQRGSQVLVDDAGIESPFVIEAIGDAATLDGGLAIPGGIRDTLTATRGVSAEVSRSDALDLPALASPPSFEVARPVASEP